MSLLLEDTEYFPTLSIKCKECKKRKSYDEYYDFAGQGHQLTCRVCTVSKNSVYYQENKLDIRTAKQMKRLNKAMGVYEARALLREYGYRSALSGVSDQLTVVLWDSSVETRLTNFILLTKKEVAHHYDVGGKSGYSSSFQSHVDAILKGLTQDDKYGNNTLTYDTSDIQHYATFKPLTKEHTSEDLIKYFESNVGVLPIFASNSQPELKPGPELHLEVDLPPVMRWGVVAKDWAREIQLWWCLKFQETAPAAVLKEIASVLEEPLRFASHV